MSGSAKFVYLLEGLIGVTVWWAMAGAAGVAEAWDAPYYFSIGYPLFALVVIVTSWNYGRGWLHGLLIMGSQVIPLLLTVPAELNPFPAGVILLGLLALPLMLLGAIASRLGRNRRRLT